MGRFGPPLIPFLSQIKSRVWRPRPDSESAQPYSESVSPSLGLTWGSSHGSESGSGRVGSFAGAFPPPRMFQPLGRQVHSTTTRGQGRRAIARRGPQSRRRRHPEVSRGPAAWRCGFDSRGRPRIPEHTRGRLLAEQTAVRLESLI